MYIIQCTHTSTFTKLRRAESDALSHYLTCCVCCTLSSNGPVLPHSAATNSRAVAFLPMRTIAAVSTIPRPTDYTAAKERAAN